MTVAYEFYFYNDDIVPDCLNFNVRVQFVINISRSFIVIFPFFIFDQIILLELVQKPNLTATLEDNGNFLLINERVLWQSFDHPTKVLLPRGVGFNMAELDPGFLAQQ
ncbi:hypothetical protein L6452_13768 [Arctium lappa]|uniref:Uncharacterized protein n=1 Tax=Arctium lappa TaxID=4217 RepID=A0ACB9CJ39_ARCLA|nr:hypothetical protein L6452_13768 [Arctium lappa]